MMSLQLVLLTLTEQMQSGRYGGKTNKENTDRSTWPHFLLKIKAESVVFTLTPYVEKVNYVPVEQLAECGKRGSSSW